MQITVWELRSLLQEALLLWSNDQIEWLMTGAAVGAPAYIITAADRHLALDYSRILLPVGRRESQAQSRAAALSHKAEQQKELTATKLSENEAFAKFRDRCVKCSYSMPF